MYFFEQGWGKFLFGENFLKRESPTLSNLTIDFVPVSLLLIDIYSNKFFFET